MGSSSLSSKSLPDIPALARMDLAVLALDSSPHPPPGDLRRESSADSWRAEGIANIFEVRCLLDLGYKWLDVRSAPEHDEEHPTLSVNIPIINAKRRFNSETKQREYIQTVNEDFIAQVEKKFPDKETKLIIGCSDGRLRSINALEALDEAGYTNIVGAKGGANGFMTLYDSKWRRRKGDGFTEAYEHDGDGCGIHGTGAGFQMSDNIVRPDQYDPTEWLDYWGEDEDEEE